MEVSIAELRLLDWQRGRAGPFVNSLFECMCTADEKNLEKLAEGFPEEIRVFKKYRHQPGYFDGLKRRCELPL